MQIKNYIVSDMSEAMRLIRAELGPEAFIVSQREIRKKGMFGVFKRKQLEVTAAVESKSVDVPKKQVVKVKAISQPTNFKKREEKLIQTSSENEPPKVQSETDYEKLISELVQKSLQNQQPVETKVVEPLVQQNSYSQFKPNGLNYQKGLALNKFSENANMDKCEEEFQPLIPPVVQVEKSLEELVFAEIPVNVHHVNDQEVKLDIELNDKASLPQTEKLELEMQEIKRMLKVALGEEVVEPAGNFNLDVRMHYLLRKYDFSDNFIQAFKQFIIDENLEGNELNSLILKRFIKQEVENRIIVNKKPLAKINIFVGPPGVGKTTTIAKIASNEILNHNNKVGLITVDTYRIGAVEQLKTYANILNTPIKVVYTVEDMKQALAELGDCDLVIIDSIGRTHKDFENLEELKVLFDGIEEKHTHLVLSLSTKYRQLERILDNYKMLGYDHLLFTKLDESDCNENILNVYYKTCEPLTYLCMGQEVPDDIMQADKSKLMNLILGGEGHA